MQGMFSDSHRLSQHAKRSTTTLQDLRLAAELRAGAMEKHSKNNECDAVDSGRGKAASLLKSHRCRWALKHSPRVQFKAGDVVRTKAWSKTPSMAMAAESHILDLKGTLAMAMLCGLPPGKQNNVLQKQVLSCEIGCPCHSVVCHVLSVAQTNSLSWCDIACLGLVATPPPQHRQRRQRMHR